MAACEESKCVSRGRTELYNYSFTCYGDDDGQFYPRMCADGYVPVVVEEEPPSIAAPWTYEIVDKLGNTYSSWQVIFDESREIPVRYHTCCPPSNLVSGEANNATRQCSDPIVAPWDNAEEICTKRGAQKHPIHIKHTNNDWVPTTLVWEGATTVDSFLCCISENTNDAKQFFDQVECVPYMNEFYAAGKMIPNRIGSCPLISCDDSKGDFIFPRPLGNGTVDDAISTGSYQCCRTGPSLPPRVHDTSFWITYSVSITLHCLATIASLVVVLGLLIPLLIQLKKGTFRAPSAHRRRRGDRPSYCSYNLYLVYLAIPDLFWSIFQIVLCGNNINQTHTATPFVLLNAAFVPLFYATINLWLNTIVLYQIMILLKSSETAQRIGQPSLRRVGVQAVSVYFLAAIVGGLYFIFSIGIIKNPVVSGLFLLIGLLVMLLPVGYGIYAGVLVCRRGYLKITAGRGDQGKRTLAIFFFRIVFIFVGCWIPSVVFVVLPMYWGTWVSGFFASIQQIATTLTILTKEDCRKYILDLVTLSYFFGECTCTCFSNKDTAPSQRDQTQATTKFGSSILDHTEVNVDHTEVNVDNSDRNATNDAENSYTENDNDDANMRC